MQRISDPKIGWWSKWTQVSMVISGVNNHIQKALDALFTRKLFCSVQKNASSKPFVIQHLIAHLGRRAIFIVHTRSQNSVSGTFASACDDPFILTQLFGPSPNPILHISPTCLGLFRLAIPIYLITTPEASLKTFTSSLVPNFGPSH